MIYSYKYSVCDRSLIVMNNLAPPTHTHSYTC